MRADCQGCGGFRGRKGGMGCDSFIHLTLKRPLRRGREMSTWRGRLREISILFPSPKRKHSSSSSASTVPEASRTCWETGGGKREQVGEGIVESCSVPLIPFLFHSCFFCCRCICFTAILIMLTQGHSLALDHQKKTLAWRHWIKSRTGMEKRLNFIYTYF